MLYSLNRTPESEELFKFIPFSKDVKDEAVQAWQDTFDWLKDERDDNDKTLIEKIDSKYMDPAYEESLINQAEFTN